MEGIMLKDVVVNGNQFIYGFRTNCSDRYMQTVHYSAVNVSQHPSGLALDQWLINSILSQC